MRKSNLSLKSETIRTLSADALRGAHGGAVNTTSPDCSQQTANVSCQGTCGISCKGTNCMG